MEYLMLVQVTKYFCPPGSALAWRSGSGFAKRARGPWSNPGKTTGIKKLIVGDFNLAFS